MDMEFLKSIPEDQMELMMMMQLDKLPEFCGLYADLSDNSSTELRDRGSSSGSGSGSTANHKLIIPNNMMINHDDRVTNSHFGPYINSPNSSSTNISFTGSGQVQAAPSLGGGETSAGSSRWPRNVNSCSYDGEFLELGGGANQEQKRNSMAAMREMIFRIAAMQPIHIDPESVKPPKRRNVKISKDPQSVAARHRRERISERIRILQRLVPGGTKMDTSSMLDEAIHYVKFLKNQVQSLERAAVNRPPQIATGIGFPVPMSSYSPMGAKGYQSPTTYCPN